VINKIEIFYHKKLPSAITQNKLFVGKSMQFLLCML